MPTFQTPDDVTLYYEDTGSGTPVIALAGLTRDLRDFDHVAPHLDVRLIRMDCRGRGKSGWADPATYTIPQEAADVCALMDHLELPRAAILGTSRGGLIAMLIAATDYRRLTGVALNDIGPEIGSRAMDAIKAGLGRNPAQATYAQAAAVRAATWTHFENVPMDRWLVEVRNHYEQTAQGLVIRYDPALRDAVVNPALSTEPDRVPDLWPLFDAMAGLPLVLLRGANSDLLAPHTAAAMVARRPDLIRVDVDGRGHVPFLDEPKSLEALNQWIGRIS